MSILNKLAPGEVDAIAAIAKRARNLFDNIDAITIMILVTEVHRRMPLRLQDLAEADDFNFSHDVAGIAQHWDRISEEMQDCFRPRFTA